MTAPRSHPHPLVSVIIPTWRRPAFLAEAVASALRQTMSNLEVVIVEDGPRHAEAIRPLDPRVRYMTQPHQGAAAARNTGAAVARGEWLAFLDDDDLFLPTKLEEQLALAARRPALGLIHTEHLLLHGRDLLPGRRLLPRHQVPSGWVGPRLFRDNFILTSSVIVRRAVFEAVSGFDPSYRRVEDYDLWLRLSRRCRFGFLDIPLTIYREHPDQKSNREIEKHLISPRILERFVAAQPGTWAEYGPATVRSRLRELRWRAGYACLMEGRLDAAVPHFLAAWRWTPWAGRPLLYAAACRGGPRALAGARRLKKWARTLANGALPGRAMRLVRQARGSRASTEPFPG